MTSTSISVRELKKQLEAGEVPNSRLIDKKEIVVRTNPCKLLIAQEAESIGANFNEVFLRSYRNFGQDPKFQEARESYNDMAEKYRTTLENAMKNRRKEFQKLTEKWELLLDDLGAPVIQDYSNPTTIEVTPRTPQEAEFWSLMQDLDHLLVMTDNVWYHNEVNMKDKNEVTNSILKGAKSICTQAATLARKLRQIADSVQQLISDRNKNDTSEKNSADVQASEPTQGSDNTKATDQVTTAETQMETAQGA